MSWQRVNKNDVCAVCQHGDWCLISEDGSAAICPRVPEGSIRYIENSGYLHILRKSDDTWRYRRTITIKEPDSPALDFEQLSQRYEAAITPVTRRELADRLGVTTESFRRLRVGWDGDSWTLPMFDADGVMIGIQRRFPNGFKCCVGKSRSGLFIATGLDPFGPLWVCEGASDTAAALTLDLDAIGRPSCSTGAAMVAKFARGRLEIVIVGDNDTAGRKGAADLAESLALYYPCVRVVFPPGKCKDLRGWYRAGLTREELLFQVEQTKPYLLKLGVQHV